MTLTLTPPLGSVTGAPLGVRFRMSSQHNLPAEGAAPDGEVEDYVIFLEEAALLDFGDLPDTGPGTGSGNYETTLVNNGPRHTISFVDEVGALNDF